MLALDWRSFDQDLSSGWRSLANSGCYEVAADLIRDWREAHHDANYLLFWHEGQLRAFAGNYRSAKDLFEKSRLPAGKDDIGWNIYVDASIAFLNRDFGALQNARKRLRLVPKPAYWDKMKGPDGRTIKGRWPANLDVLDGFIHCWDVSYREAYSCPRREG